MAFPIDLDSVFNNLLVNSLEAFKRPDALPNKREVKISISDKRDHLLLIYEDNGPGLDKSIKNPYEILEAFFTTKLDSTGKEVGTGLGMWIINNIVEEYKGQIEISGKRPGYKMKIFLPKLKNE